MLAAAHYCKVKYFNQTRPHK